MKKIAFLLIILSSLFFTAWGVAYAEDPTPTPTTSTTPTPTPDGGKVKQLQNQISELQSKISDL